MAREARQMACATSGRSGPPAQRAVPADAPATANGAGDAGTAGQLDGGAGGAREARPGLRTVLGAVDLVAVTASWVWASVSFDGSGKRIDRVLLGVIGAATMLLAMRALELYRSRRCARKRDELWRIAVAGLCGATAYVVVQVQWWAAGTEVFVGAGVAVAIATLGRWAFERRVRSWRAQGRHLRGVVLVGADEDATELLTMLRSEPELGYEVVAVVGDMVEATAWHELPAARSVTDIPSLAAATGATGILLAPYGLSRVAAEQAIAVATASRLHVQLWSGFRSIGSRRLRSVPLSGEPFFYVEPAPLSRWRPWAKRAMDVAGSVTLLILAAPVLAVAAVLVKLDDGGPVLYRHERIGLGGRPFVVYKLR